MLFQCYSKSQSVFIISIWKVVPADLPCELLAYNESDQALSCHYICGRNLLAFIGAQRMEASAITCHWPKACIPLQIPVRVKWIWIEQCLYRHNFKKKIIHYGCHSYYLFCCVLELFITYYIFCFARYIFLNTKFSLKTFHTLLFAIDSTKQLNI